MQTDPTRAVLDKLHNNNIESLVRTGLLGFSNIVERLEVKLRDGRAFSYVSKAKNQEDPNFEMKVNQKAVLRIVDQIGHGARVLHRDDHLTIEEWLDARTLSRVEIMDSKIWHRAVAGLGQFLRKVNQTEASLPQPKAAFVNYLLEAGFQHKAVSNLHQLRLMTQTRYSQSDLTLALESISSLLVDKKMSSVIEAVNKRQVAICHNDFYWLNIMQRRADDSLIFIDYEYMGYNPIGMDVVNCCSEVNYLFDQASNSFTMENRLPSQQHRLLSFKVFLMSLSTDIPCSQQEQMIEDVEKGLMDSSIDLALAEDLASDQTFFSLMAVQNLVWILFNICMLQLDTPWPLLQYTLLKLEMQKKLLSYIRD